MRVHVAQDEAECREFINRVVKQRLAFHALDHTGCIPANARPKANARLKAHAEKFGFGNGLPDCKEVSDEEEQEHGKETGERSCARLCDSAGSLEALDQAVAYAVGSQSAQGEEEPPGARLYVIAEGIPVRRVRNATMR